MKKQTKGIIFTVIFGGGLLFWATAASMPNIMPPETDDQTTVTGTPADNFVDEQRAQFCGTGEAKSNSFVTEYKIPTPCTQPLAITTSPDGAVWVAQVNTGNIAKFNPFDETFTEYENPSWPNKGRSMMWGMDYSPDGNIWYTDEAFDSIWKFSIEDETYQRIDYPSEENSLPQRLEVHGSQIIVNDFTGNKLTILDPTQSNEGIVSITIPSEVTSALTSDFTVDAQNNVWYTNWIFQQSGVLVKFDHDEFLKSGQIRDSNFSTAFLLPPTINTPNGAAADNNGNIWLADTSSSFIFKFDSENEEFVQYTTSVPSLSTYGNYTGVVKSPISRPYWIDVTSDEKIVFNEHAANRVGLLDPDTESLVEYFIPSKNRFWGDCGEEVNCGLAQVFDFVIDGNKIWFSEWAENNIGVIDTSIPLPFTIETNEKSLTLSPGESKNITYVINSQTDHEMSVSLNISDNLDFVEIIPTETPSNTLESNSQKSVEVIISTDESAIPGTYKVLLGAQTEDVTISNYVTLKITQ